MAGGAKLFEIIYVDTLERVPVLVGVGDTIVAQDWVEREYSYPPKPDLSGLEAAQVDLERDDYSDAKYRVDRKREERAGLYAVYLGAKRAKLRGADEDWIEWLSLVTMPDDDDSPAAEEPAAGESNGPSSAA